MFPVDLRSASSFGHDRDLTARKELGIAGCANHELGIGQNFEGAIAFEGMNRGVERERFLNAPGTDPNRSDFGRPREPEGSKARFFDLEQKYFEMNDRRIVRKSFKRDFGLRKY